MECSSVLEVKLSMEINYLQRLIKLTLCCVLISQFKIVKYRIIIDIPHCCVVSSAGGDSTSMFLYMKVKGEMERDLKEKKVNMISVFKPGLIKNRSNARTGEKVLQFFSFLPFSQIDCWDIGKCMMKVVEQNAE